MSILSHLGRLLRITPKYDPSLIVRDIVYFSGTDAHVNHKLDIFLPFPKTNLQPSSADNKKIPVILHVHGGTWVHGNRKDEWFCGPTVGRACAREDFVGVIVSYRLAPISLISFLAWAFVLGLITLIIGLALHSWKLITGYIASMIASYAYYFLYKARTPVYVEHMIDDLCYALVYIRDHINEHCPNADPNQIFLSGHSSGAHLVSLLVLDRSHLLRHEFPLSSIRGVVAMSGVYTLSNPTHDSKNNISTWIYRIFVLSNLLYPEGKEMNEYSPIEYIKDDRQLPPFLVMSARFDMGLEIDAKRFVERLKRYQHSVEYHIIGGMTTHETIMIKFATNEAHRHFFTFIRQHMK